MPLAWHVAAERPIATGIERAGRDPHEAQRHSDAERDKDALLDARRHIVRSITAMFRPLFHREPHDSLSPSRPIGQKPPTGARQAPEMKTASREAGG